MTNKEVIERLNLMQERCCNGYDAEAIYLAKKAFENRPQGEWEVRVNNLNYERTIHCSKCDYHFEAWRDRPNFCPNCGAEMRGGR